MIQNVNTLVLYIYILLQYLDKNISNQIKDSY